MKLLVPITFSAITNCDYPCFCNQMGYIFWGLEVIYGSCTIALFRLVGPKHILNLRFPSLSFPSRSTKLLIQRVAWWTGFKTPACNILSISFLKDSFKMNWDWLARGLLGCDTRIYLNMVWGTRKASNTFENIWISFMNLIFACNKLGHYTFVVRHYRFLSGNMNTDFGLGLLWVVSTTGNKAGYRWMIVQYSARLYQAKCKCCHTRYQNTGIITGHIECYLL